MYIKFTNFSTHEIYENLNPTKITNLIVSSYTMKWTTDSVNNSHFSYMCLSKMAWKMIH